MAPAAKYMPAALARPPYAFVAPARTNVPVASRDVRARGQGRTAVRVRGPGRCQHAWPVGVVGVHRPVRVVNVVNALVLLGVLGIIGLVRRDVLSRIAAVVAHVFFLCGMVNVTNK